MPELLSLRRKYEDLVHAANTCRTSVAVALGQFGRLRESAGEAHDHLLEVDVRLSIAGLCAHSGFFEIARRQIEAARVIAARHCAPEAMLRLRAKEVELLRCLGNQGAAASAAVTLLATETPPSLEITQLRVLTNLIPVYLEAGCCTLAAATARWGLGQCDVRPAWLPYRWMMMVLELESWKCHAVSRLEFNRERLFETHVGGFPDISFEDAMGLCRGVVSRMATEANQSTQLPEPVRERLEMVAGTLQAEVMVLAGAPGQTNRLIEMFRGLMSAGHPGDASPMLEVIVSQLAREGRSAEALSIVEEFARHWTASTGTVAADIAYYRFKTCEALGLQGEALSAFKAYVGNVLGRRDRGNALMPTLVAELSGKDLPQPVNSLAISRSPWYLRSAVRMIDQNLTDPNLTVKAVATSCGISERTLRDAFVVHYGVSTKTYLTNRRVDAASRLLAGYPSGTTRAQFRQIAEQCGANRPDRLAKAIARRSGRTQTAIT
jgi:AraC-like DNA-binding protein